MKLASVWGALGNLGAMGTSALGTVVGLTWWATFGSWSGACLGQGDALGAWGGLAGRVAAVGTCLPL